MQSTSKIKSQLPFQAIISAVKKLTIEEKQLLRQQLFATDAIAEMRAFELQLKKKKASIKKTDEEIVSITTSIRAKKYANAKKILY